MDKIIKIDLQLTPEQYNYLIELEKREKDEEGILRMIIGMCEEAIDEN